MKKFLAAIAFGMMAITAQAEATFDQIEGLIQQKQYAAAEAGLEVIISNHPKSAKAFYAMAQAQAGLGNLEKAQKALNIATGLNPTLDFAPASSVASLKQAITPQTAKIEAVEESHGLRNFMLFAMFAGFGVACYFLYSVYMRKQEEESAREAEVRAEMDRRAAESKRQWQEMIDKQEAERKEAEEKIKAHKNYGKPGFDPANPDKLKTKAQLKKEADDAARIEAEVEARRQRLRADAAEAEANRARLQSQSVYGTPPTHTTVVNNSGNDMLTGIMIGNMMSGSHHDHHDTTIIRETVREVPAPRSSWDDIPSTPAPSKSSSWDDTPSTPSRSSSWDSDSSSSSSSSWSSSSSSDSGSSWSSSSSDSSSSSSWD